MVDFKYADLFKKDSVDKQLQIAFDSGTITNTELHQGQFELNESLCSEENLRFGSCEASSIKFRISNISTPLTGNWLTVTETLDGNTDVSFSYGKYKVSSDKPTADRRFRDIVAYDAMYDILNAEVSAWYNTILPEADSVVTMKEFRDSFFSYFGIEQEEVTLVNDSMIVTKTIDPSQLSGKTVITSICEINGCFGHIGRNGKFQYVYLPDSILGVISNAEEISSNIYTNAEYEDFTTEKITKLQIRKEENDIGCIYGTGDNCYIVQDNFLLYGKSSYELENIAQNLYGAISNVQYCPARVLAKGNPCLEVGDGVYFTTNGKTIYTYVLQRTLKGIQALRDTYDADGEQYQSENVNSVHESIIQLKGKSNALERSIEETKSTIKDVESGLQTKITQNASSISAEITRATGAETGLSNRISATENKFSVKIEEIQKEIDGEIVTYNVPYVPTLLNYPAWDFTYNIPCDGTVACTDVPMIYNDEYYSRNARSVVFNEVTSMSYRFTKGENGEWYWRDIGDTDFGIAMQKISELEITTDSISATVEQNQIYNNQQISSMSSRITQTAESITSEVSRATNAESSLSSKINQTAEQIELKVTKGEVSSQLSIESGQVTLKSNRFVLESTNCSISKDGSITAKNVDLSGKITTSSGEIGGFTIGTSSLYTIAASSLGGIGVHVGTDGISCASSGTSSVIKSDGSAEFRTNDGIKIYSSSSNYTYIKPSGITIKNSTYTDTTYTEKTIDCYSSFEINSYNGITIDVKSIGTRNVKILAGSLTYADFETTTSYIYGGNTGLSVGRSGSKLGFFGSTGDSKKSITVISTTSSATASSCATKINEILTALKAYNLIG